MQKLHPVSPEWIGIFHTVFTYGRGAQAHFFRCFEYYNNSSTCLTSCLCLDCGPVVIENHQKQTDRDVVLSNSKSYDVPNEQTVASLSDTFKLHEGDSTILQKSNVVTGRQSRKDASADENSLAGLTVIPLLNNQYSRKKSFVDVRKCESSAAAVTDIGAVQQSQAFVMCIASKSNKSVVPDSRNRFPALQRATIFYPPAFRQQLAIPNDAVVGLSDVSGTKSHREGNFGIIESQQQTHTNSLTVVQNSSVADSVPKQQKRKCRISSRPQKRSLPGLVEEIPHIAVEETSLPKMSNSQTMADDSVPQVTSTVFGVVAKLICNPEILCVPSALPTLKVLDTSCSGMAEEKLVSGDVAVEMLHKPNTTSEFTEDRRQPISSILKFVKNSSMQAISPGRIVQTSCKRSKYEMSADIDKPAAARSPVAVDVLDYSVSDTTPVDAPDYSVADTRQIDEHKTTAVAAVMFDFIQVDDASIASQVSESLLHEKANNLVNEESSKLKISTTSKKQCGPLTLCSIDSSNVDIVVAMPKKIPKRSRITSRPGNRHLAQRTDTLNGAFDGAPCDTTSPMSPANIFETDFGNELMSPVISTSKPLHRATVISKQEQSNKDFDLEAHDASDAEYVEHPNQYHTAVTEEKQPTALSAVISRSSAAPTPELSRRVSIGHSGTLAGSYEQTQSPKECNVDLFECSENESTPVNTKTTAAESMILSICKAIDETNVCAITQPQSDLSTNVLAVDELTTPEVLQVQATSSTLAQISSNHVDSMPAKKMRQVRYKSCLQVSDFDVPTISELQTVRVETPLKRKTPKVSLVNSPDSILPKTVEETFIREKQPEVSISPVSRNVQVIKKLCASDLLLASVIATASESVTSVTRGTLSSDCSLIASGLVVEAEKSMATKFETKIKQPIVTLMANKPCYLRSDLSDSPHEPRDVQSESYDTSSKVQYLSRKPEDIRGEQSEVQRQGKVVLSTPKNVASEPRGVPSELIDKSMELSGEYSDMWRMPGDVRLRHKSGENKNQPHGFERRKYKLVKQRRARLADSRLLSRELSASGEHNLASEIDLGHKASGTIMDNDKVCDNEIAPEYARSYGSISPGESHLGIIKLPASMKPYDSTAAMKKSVIPESAEKQILSSAVWFQELPQQLDTSKGAAVVSESTSAIEQPRYSAPKIPTAHEKADLSPVEVKRNSYSDNGAVYEELHADITSVSHSVSNNSEKAEHSCVELVQKSSSSDSDSGGLADVTGGEKNEGSWKEAEGMSFNLILSSSESEDVSHKNQPSTGINQFIATHQPEPLSYCTPGQVYHDNQSTLLQALVISGAIPVKRTHSGDKVLLDTTMPRQSVSQTPAEHGVRKKGFCNLTDNSSQREDVEHCTFLRSAKRDSAEPTKYPVMLECKVRLTRTRNNLNVKERQKLQHSTQQKDAANRNPTYVSSKKSIEDTAIQVMKHHAIDERKNRGADSAKKTERESKHPKGHNSRQPTISEYVNFDNITSEREFEGIEKTNGKRASVTPAREKSPGAEFTLGRSKARIVKTAGKNANLSRLRKAVNIVASHLSSKLRVDSIHPLLSCKSTIALPPWPSSQKEIPSLGEDNASSIISSEEESTLNTNSDCFGTKRAISECESSSTQLGSDITSTIELSNIESDQISEAMNCAEEKKQGNQAMNNRIERFHSLRKPIYQQNEVAEVSQSDESAGMCKSTLSAVSEVTSMESIPLVIHVSAELENTLPYSLSALTTQDDSRGESFTPGSDITGTVVSVLRSQTLCTDNSDTALASRLQIAEEIAGQSHLEIHDLVTLSERGSGDIRELMRDPTTSKTVVSLQRCTKASVQRDQQVHGNNNAKECIVTPSTMVGDEHNASGTPPDANQDISGIYQERETSIITLDLEHDIFDMTSDLEFSSPSKTAEKIHHASDVAVLIENNIKPSNKTLVTANELNNSISTESKDCDVVELQHICSANVVDITIVQKRNVILSIEPGELELSEPRVSNTAVPQVVHYSSILE